MKGRKMSAKERREKLESDATERRKVFRELLDHVRAGYSIDCFPALSDTSIRNYLNLYSKEFIREELEDALRDGKRGWEDIGRRQANGSCLGNSRSWYYNMANRYGWREKLEVEAEHKGSVSVSVISYATQRALHDTKEPDVT